MRLLAMSLLFCAALTTGCFAAERFPPLPDRRLKHSRRQMTPDSRRPLATRWATRYRNALSSRRHSAARKRFSSDTAHAIATVTRRKSISSGCATAKSPSGKNFSADFQGWLTHYVWECKVRTFQVLDNFKVNQRFRWTGTHFEKIATATK